MREVLARSWVLFVTIGLAAAITSGLIWRNMLELELAEREDLRSAFTTVLDSTTGAVRMWSQEEQREARVWAGSLGKSNLELSPEYLQQILEPLMTVQGNQGYLILHEYGEVLAADQDTFIGGNSS